jgi:hypothetical protein
LRLVTYFGRLSGASSAKELVRELAHNPSSREQFRSLGWESDDTSTTTHGPPQRRPFHHIQGRKTQFEHLHRSPVVSQLGGAYILVLC